MSALQSAIFILCGAIFVASILKMLSPSGMTDKVLKLIIGLFVLCCLVTSIRDVYLSLSSNLNLSGVDEGIMTSKTDQLVLETTAEYLAEYSHQFYEGEGVDVKEVQVTVNDFDSVIKVTEVNIYIDKNSEIHIPKLKELTKSMYSLEPEITVEAENER